MGVYVRVGALGAGGIVGASHPSTESQGNCAYGKAFLELTSATWAFLIGESLWEMEEGQAFRL